MAPSDDVGLGVLVYLVVIVPVVYFVGVIGGHVVGEWWRGR